MVESQIYLTVINENAWHCTLATNKSCVNITMHFGNAANIPSILSHLTLHEWVKSENKNYSS